jgi:hypothetical protein
MSDSMEIDQHYIRDYVTPGMAVQLVTKSVEKGKPSLRAFGADGNFFYQGYCQLCNQVFLIFRHTEGVGKKASTKTLSINASHCFMLCPHEQ